MINDQEIGDLVLQRFNAHVNYMLPRIANPKVKIAFAKYASYMMDLVANEIWPAKVLIAENGAEEDASKMIFDIYQEIYNTTKLRFGGDERGNLMEIERL